MRHAIPISGKDSLATALVQSRLAPELPYEFFFNDVMMELPETYKWIDDIEKKLSIKITRIGKSLEEIIFEQGMIPGPTVRFCTKYGKIFPMRDYFKGENTTVYIGLRFDEERDGNLGGKNIIVKYPLRECRIDLQGVFSILESFNLHPPKFFWNRLHKTVREKMGEKLFDKLVRLLPTYIFDRTFAWRSRPNCFCCFYQRRYEWVGLLEHHPKLFDRAEELEVNMTDRRESAYYWISKDIPLSIIRERSDEIFQSRVSAVFKMIMSMNQKGLFVDSFMDGIELAQKSCGLFCGK